MLNRRNIFPCIGVRGGEKTGGWLIYQANVPVAAAAAATAGTGSSECPAALQEVQENILKVLHAAAHPSTPGVRPHYSLPAGKLVERCSKQLQRRFNYRDYGFGSLRELLEACPRLSVELYGKHERGKTMMHVAAREEREARVAREAREEKRRCKRGPEEVSSGADAGVASADGAGGSPSADAAAAKAARKAAKRAEKAVEGGEGKEKDKKTKRKSSADTTV